MVPLSFSFPVRVLHQYIWASRRYLIRGPFVVCTISHGLWVRISDLRWYMFQARWSLFHIVLNTIGQLVVLQCLCGVVVPD